MPQNEDLSLPIEEQIYEAQPSEILVLDRQRKHFGQRELAELCESMKNEGQHTPGLCYRNAEGRLVLIFGERRLRACESLGIPFRYQFTPIIPDEFTLGVLELSENIKRANLTPMEECQAKERLHRLFQERYGVKRSGPGRQGHSLGDTAKFLGQSVGSMSEDVKIAEFAKFSPEVASAKTKKEAKALIQKLEQTTLREIKLDQARAKAEATGTCAFLDPAGRAVTKDEFDARLTYYDSLVLQDKMENIVPGLPPSHVVLFDPPWGVDYHEVGELAPGQKSYKDELEWMMTQLPKWLAILWENMAPASHLYMFFGIVNHSFIYQELERAGFETNRMPLFWFKQGAHRVRQPKLWPGRSYEAIAFARKGDKPLVQMGRPDIIPTPPPTPNMKDCHPSAKHPAVYRDLLLRSCNPGETVLDPMAGSGMAGVAIESLRKTHELSWTLIERDPDFRSLILFNLSRGYDNLVGDTTERSDDLPTDFRELEPGSENWKRFWKLHPELHDEMIAWRTTEG